MEKIQYAAGIAAIMAWELQTWKHTLSKKKKRNVGELWQPTEHLLEADTFQTSGCQTEYATLRRSLRKQGAS